METLQGTTLELNRCNSDPMLVKPDANCSRVRVANNCLVLIISFIMVGSSKFGQKSSRSRFRKDVFENP